MAKYEAVLESINLSNDISDLMDKDLEKLKILREQKLPQTDILAKAVSSESLNMSKDGTYNLTLDNIKEPGFYEVDIKVDGTDSQTGHKFSESKKHTIIVA